jgi:hypothetical protein
MVTNIRESKTTLELATNAGTKTTKQVADVPGFGMVWYDDTAIANIFGLSDLKKKHRITRSEYLTLSADDLRVVKWYVDASFAVHPDFKSHTGAVMMLGKGAMQSEDCRNC